MCGVFRGGGVAGTAVASRPAPDDPLDPADRRPVQVECLLEIGGADLQDPAALLGRQVESGRRVLLRPLLVAVELIRELGVVDALIVGLVVIVVHLHRGAPFGRWVSLLTPTGELCKTVVAKGPAKAYAKTVTEAAQSNHTKAVKSAGRVFWTSGNYSGT